jgi:predicted solute-binding protein
VAEARAIARRAAPLHGWPTAVAERYLCETMKYTITPDMQRGMARFFDLSRRHGLLP